MVNQIISGIFITLHSKTYLISRIKFSSSPKHTSFLLPFTFGNDALESGAMGQLQFIVTYRDSPVQITWSFHGKDSTTRTQKGVSIMKVGERSSLRIIDSVDSEKNGIYTCC